MNIEKLKDILDMENYLNNKCYCKGEIYSDDGFFFMTFNKEDKCKFLGEHKNFISVLCEDQILVFWKSEDNKTIQDAIRYDATENNIKLVKEILLGKIEKGIFDIFPSNTEKQSLEKIMSIADAIMIN